MPMRAVLFFLFATLTIPFSAAQQNQSDNPPDNQKTATAKKEKNRKEPANTPGKPVVESNQPAAQPGPSATEAADKSKGLWLILILVGIFVCNIGFFVSIWYLIMVDPQVKRMSGYPGRPGFPGGH